MGKKELPEDEGPSDAWLASYADAMTLLLAFFIMMYAFALVDLAKFQDLKVGVQAAFGLPKPVTDNTDSLLSDGEGIAPEVGFDPIDETVDKVAESKAAREQLAGDGTVTPENVEDLRNLLDNEFQRVGAADYVEVGIDERGVYIRFDGHVLFDPNSADLDNAGLTLLTTSAGVLNLIDNMLDVEGHTDNLPTSSPWPSNWELSSARASTVVRWLIQVGGIPDPQLMAVGRADTKPRSDNATPEGRAENRRVEIVVRVPGLLEAGVDVMGDPTGIDDAFGDLASDDSGAGANAGADPTAVDGDATPSDGTGTASGSTDTGSDGATPGATTPAQPAPADPAPVQVEPVSPAPAEGSDPAGTAPTGAAPADATTGGATAPTEPTSNP